MTDSAAKIKRRSLADQIKDAEHRVLTRRYGVRVHSAMLERKIRHQMTSPGTLLLAGGAGFLIGALTKRRAPRPESRSKTPQPGETPLLPVEATPLMVAMNLVTSAYTLYRTLPVASIVKSLRRRRVRQPVPEQQLPTGPDASAVVMENQGGTTSVSPGAIDQGGGRL